MTVLPAAGLGITVLGAAALMLVAIGASGAQEPADVRVRPLELRWVEPHDVRLPQVEGELDPVTVLAIRASGYPSDITGSVQQCATGETRRCRNRVAVRTDDLGAAAFQYLVTDEIDSDGACRLASPLRCTIELSLGDRLTEVETVFVDAAPAPGILALEPEDDLEIGDSVSVVATGFAPGIELTLQVCAAPATRGDRCGPPGPQANLVTDADGAARTTIVLDVDRVGEADIACGRRTRCHLVTTSGTVGARAAPVLLAFADTPGASYDGVRLTIGLTIALLLVVTTAGLARTVDWRPPAEADASLIDDAAWADLDAEADAFEEAVPT